MSKKTNPVTKGADEAEFAMKLLNAVRKQLQERNIPGADKLPPIVPDDE